MKATILFAVLKSVSVMDREAMPASHRHIMIVLADRADEHGIAWPSKTQIASETGLSKATVCRALGELEEAGWLRLLERGGGRAHTRFQVMSSGGATRGPSTRRTPDVAQPDHATSPPSTPEQSTVDTRAVHPTDSSLPKTGDHFLMEPPMEPPNKPPTEPPKPAPTREGGQALLSLVIGGAPTLKPSKTKPPRRDPATPTAKQRYATAYAAGIVDAAGGVFVPPTDSHAEYVLRSVAKHHALAADGSPLTGEALDAWIRSSAAEYRRARGDRAAFEGGFKPSNWKAWLESGKAAPNAGPRKARVQPGELDMDRIHAESERRAQMARDDIANGVVF